MRSAPNLRIDAFRMPNPGDGRVYRDNDGYYEVPCRSSSVPLRVVASDGLGWDHVSVSLPTRTPTWAEMELVRKLFFRDDEVVLQFGVPLSNHINIHNFCLHWWRPQGVEIQLPPKEMV